MTENCKNEKIRKKTGKKWTKSDSKIVRNGPKTV